VNLIPTAPTIRGLVKIHKKGAPIRPIINWRNAPGYKLAKMLSKKLHTYIPLPYTFNVRNTVQLMNDLTDLPYDHNIKFPSFDINNMYSNIPTSELIKIICELYEINDTEDKIKQDVMKIAQVLIEQNYFHFQDKIYIQKEGLVMGALTSSIFSISAIHREHQINCTAVKIESRRLFQIRQRYSFSIKRRHTRSN
jgi:hypothetical protein